MYLGKPSRVAYQNLLPTQRTGFRRAGHGPGARTICDHTGGHPFHTQHLCHAAWELCAPDGKVDAESIESAIELLLNRESYAYSALWKSLTPAQRRTLIGLSSEPEEAQVYSADFIRTYPHLQFASTVQSAVRALLERDLIDRENGSFLILDRFFRLWITRSAHRD